MDLSRQCAVRRDRRAKQRDGQRKARQVRADLRTDRRAAAAKTLAAAASLPDDGVEALARGARHSLEPRTKILPLRRHSGDAAGDRGQSCRARTLTGYRWNWGARCGSGRKRSPIPPPFQRPPRGPVSMPRRCVRPALPTPNSMRCMSSIRRRPGGGRVRRAELCAAVGRDFLGPGPAGFAGAGVAAGDCIATRHGRA